MPFGNLGTIWSEVGLDLRKLDAGLMQAQLKLAGADKTITSWGQKLSNQSTKLITIGGLMAGAMVVAGVASVKMAANFETSMRNVNSISRMSEEQLKKISDEVLTLSTKMPQSAKVLADGLYDIASSGFAGAEGMKVLEASAKAASAGMTDTATSAKGVTAVLNAYGFAADDAGKVSDTMFRTVDKGVITFEELSNTVGDFVGMGKIANLSFEELSGALGYMTIKGLDASTAGVSLNRVILSIIDPSKELAEALKNAGYESGEAALHQLGLVGTMEMLSKSTGGSLTELQKLFPEMRALRGASALLSTGIDDLNTYMLDFKDTTGATNIALAEQSKALEYQMLILKNNASAVAISIGTELIPSVTKYVTKLSTWISTHQELAGSIVKITGGVVGLGGGLLLLAGIIGKVRLAMLKLSGATGAALGVIAALAVVVAVGVKSWNDYKFTVADAEKVIIDLDTAIRQLNKTSREHGDTSFIASNRMNNAIDVIKELAQTYPELADEMVEIARLSHEEIDNIDETSQKIQDLAEEYTQISADPMRGYYEQMHKNTFATVDAKVAAQDHETAIASLAARYPELTAAELEEKLAMDEATGAIDDQTEAADELKKAIDDLGSALESGAVSPAEYIRMLSELGIALNEVEDGFNNIIEAAFKFYNNQYALEESTAKYKEELKKLAKMQEVHTVTTGGSNEALLANINAQENLTKANENYQKVISNGESTQKQILEATISLTNAQKNADDTTKGVVSTTKTYTASQEELDKQIKVITDDYMEMLNWGMLIYDQNTKALAQGDLTAEQNAFATEQNKILQEEFIESGLQAVGFKTISLESFFAMATGFGLSVADIVKFADEMGIKLDEETQARIIDIKVKLDDKEFYTRFNAVKKAINEIGTGYMMALGYSQGGIVKAYAGGGIIGNDGAYQPIGTAAGGMVIPQTGRTVPILAHEGEMILNSSQQDNLIQALWGVANGKSIESGGGVNIGSFNVITPKGTPSEIVRETKHSLRLMGMEAQIR